MIESTLDRARAGDGEAFRELTEPCRRELQVRCYRLLGSVQDAEDAVQETLPAAWRRLGGFQGRASVRAWLHRIATNRCLNVRCATRAADRSRHSPPDAPSTCPSPRAAPSRPRVRLLPPRSPQPDAHAHALVVLTLEGDRISASTRFGDNGLLPLFGLPRTLRDP